MILQFWKFEIRRNGETGRFEVCQLFINKGRFGGNVVSKSLFDSERFEDCAKFCRDHSIKLCETRGET